MKNENKNLAWKEVGKKEILKTVVMTVNETTSISPEGDQAHFVVMDAPDWAIVIAEKNDKFLMVKQWRHGEDSLSIEFPGGVIEEGEDPAVAAARELKEETGFTAGKLTCIGKMNPNPALFRNHIHVFAAEDLTRTGTQNLDSDEFLEYFEIPKAEVYEKMGSPEYPHALMVSALFRYKIHVDK